MLQSETARATYQTGEILLLFEESILTGGWATWGHGDLPHLLRVSLSPCHSTSLAASTASAIVSRNFFAEVVAGSSSTSSTP